MGQGRSSALEKCRQARREVVPVPGVKPAGRGQAARRRQWGRGDAENRGHIHS